MTHGSLFAGVEGFGLGFETAGFQTLWQVEINAFCRGVLRKNFPDAKRFKDVRKCGRHNLKPVDVITAGVPCQDWSVAGKRAGIGGARSGLFFEFARIVGELRPPWFVFENVPGLLSAGGGRDFGIVLSTLDALGYGLSWRVLDSRFFGVAQRRRRVFVIGSLGTMRSAAVLFESASGTGNPAKSGEAGKDVAFALAARSGGTGSDSSRLGNARNTSYAVTGNMRNRSQGPANYVSFLDGQPYADREAEHTRLVLGRWPDSGHAGLLDAGKGTDDARETAFSLRASDGHHGRSSPRGDGCDNLVAPIAFYPTGGTHGVSAYEDESLAVKCGSGKGGNPPAVAATLPPANHHRSHAAGRRREDDVNLVATLNSGGNDGGFRTEPGEHLIAFNASDYANGAFEESETSRPITGSTDRSRGVPIALQRGEVPLRLRNDDGFPVVPKLGGTGRRRLDVDSVPSVRDIPDGNGNISAVSFSENQRGEVVTSEISHQLTSGGGKPGQGYPAVAFNIIGGGQHSRNHAYETERTGALQHKGNSASGNEAGTLVGAPPDANRMRDTSGIPEGMDDSLLPEGQDSARYRALGNAVTATVAYWLATRIARVHSSYES